MENVEKKLVRSFEKTSLGHKEDLRRIANEILSDEGQENVEEYFDNGEIERVQTYLLGALDVMSSKKLISDKDAQEKYRILGMDKERASRIRQSTVGHEDHHA